MIKKWHLLSLLAVCLVFWFLYSSMYGHAVAAAEFYSRQIGSGQVYLATLVYVLIDTVFLFVLSPLLRLIERIRVKVLVYLLATIATIVLLGLLVFASYHVSAFDSLITAYDLPPYGCLDVCITYGGSALYALGGFFILAIVNVPIVLFAVRKKLAISSVKRVVRTELY